MSRYVYKFVCDMQSILGQVNFTFKRSLGIINSQVPQPLLMIHIANTSMKQISSSLIALHLSFPQSPTQYFARQGVVPQRVTDHD